MSLAHRPIEVWRVSADAARGPAAFRRDRLAVEEPLEIRLGRAGGEHHGVSITMRTPGHEADLALGFLVGEGVLSLPSQVASADLCGSIGNVVRVELNPGVEIDLERFKRNFTMTSACGVCGKSSLEALRTLLPQRSESSGPSISADFIRALPDKLRTGQSGFDATGGVHAAGLFDAYTGELEILREDVGRHNALDKVIGAAFRAGRLPLRESVVMLSGRISFELVQKAAMAGVPILAAIGAPSSLAVELGREAGMTLAAFVRDGRFNIYSGESRIVS